ncbi:MAG: glycosyltransferase family 4 protein [Gaiellales bacterium]|nr:glycosyltransferase family 4 protein [Gaiellales bacterium]
MTPPLSEQPAARDAAPRLLFITNDFPPRVGGFQSYYWGLVRTLRPEDVVIMAPAHPRAAAFDATHPYRVVRTRESVVWPTPRNLRVAEDLAAEHDAELVQLGHPLPAGLLGPALARRRGLPYVVMLGGAELTLPATWPVGGQLLRYVLGNARLLITVSDYTTAAAQRLLGARVPAHTVRPAMDVDRFPLTSGAARAQARRRLGVTGTLVLCVGRLVPRKGQDHLVEAVGRLATKWPDLEVALVGGGRLSYHLQKRAGELGIGERVRLLGSLSAPEMAQWLEAADIFASPCRSRWGGLEVEGFGIVFVEAALCGLPVLAGRSGGSVEAAKTGDTGIVVDGASVDEVTAGLERLLRAGEARRAELGLAGRRLGLERHDPEAVGRRYRLLLAEAAARPAAPVGTGREA